MKDRNIIQPFDPMASAGNRPFIEIPGEYVPMDLKANTHYSPDGDSIHLRALDDKLWKQLDPGRNKILGNLKRSKDRSIQLRFDLTDATETHYKIYGQPYGFEARDILLKKLGFDLGSIKYDAQHRILEIDPATVPGYIYARRGDGYGRPISLLYTGKAPKSADGDGWVNADDVPVEDSLNYWLLTVGQAYITLYSSSPVSHQQKAIEASRIALEKKLGVWGIDTTNEFTFNGYDSIGPNSGKAMLPKIFRRLIDYILAMEHANFKGSFVDFLVATETKVFSSDELHSFAVPPSGQPDQADKEPVDRNDWVMVKGAKPVRMSTLLTHKGDKITFSASPLDLVWIEKG